jgi:hypothetical protein
MKNKLMPVFDKVLLRKRALIECVNDQLKNVSQIEHSRHRSAINGHREHGSSGGRLYLSTEETKLGPVSEARRTRPTTLLRCHDGLDLRRTHVS